MYPLDLQVRKYSKVQWSKRFVFTIVIIIILFMIVFIKLFSLCLTYALQAKVV